MNINSFDFRKVWLSGYCCGAAHSRRGMKNSAAVSLVLAMVCLWVLGAPAQAGLLKGMPTNY